MRLKKMEITGFKSFCDKCSIDFPSGISAIVGPNGCGKSNIVDALRWAMGEQSVKQLRGKSMEDVIFAGTNGRAPLNMAEVSLIFANDNGSGPESLKDFSEIMLTRRLYRSGESAYLMNKQPCRLKDIHNIFYGSGMGPKSYAVIQQGNIGAITEAGPDERRYFIEEAAGTTRYKHRKIETLRKLESTQQNLLRVKDIVSEVERQMNQLKRQARKAERYRSYQERIRLLDIGLSFHRYDDCSQQIMKNEFLLKELKDEDVGLAAKLKKLDAAIEAVKLRRAKKEHEVSEQKSRRFELQRRIDRHENELRHLREDAERIAEEQKSLQNAHVQLTERNGAISEEMAEIETKNTRLSEDVESVNQALAEEARVSQTMQERVTALSRDLDVAKSGLMDAMNREMRFRNALQSVTTNRDSLNRRLKRIDEEEAATRKKVEALAERERGQKEDVERLQTEMEGLAGEISALRDDLGDRNKALSRQIQQVQQLDYERNQLGSRWNALKKMEDNFEWYRDGVKSVMRQRVEGDGLLGLVADVLTPEPEYRLAVEAALGDALQYVLVASPEDGIRAVERLASEKLGRCGFLPVETNAVEPSCSDSEPLLSRVRVKAGGEAAARMLLGNVVVVENLSEAIRVRSTGTHKATCVSREGAVLLPNGALVGGSPENLSGILQKKQEIEDLARSVSEMEARLNRLKASQKEMEADIHRLEQRLQAKVEAKQRTAEAELAASKQLFQTAESLKQERRNLDMFRMEQDQLAGEAGDLDEKMAGNQALLEKVVVEVRAAQTAVAEKTEALRDVSGEAETVRQKTMDLKLKQTSLKAEMDNSVRALNRLREFKKDGEHRLSQLEADVRAKTAREADARRKADELASRLLTLHEELDRMEASLMENQAHVSSIDEQLRENDESVSQVQSQREELLQKIRLMEVEQAQLKIRRENIENRVFERYHQPLRSLRAQFPEDTASLSPEKTEAELTRLRGKLDRLGPVNLGAIDAYEAHKERHDFLIAQQEDLEKAVEDLHKVIRKINRISQERFLATFQQINEKLGEVFPKLFGGGTAKLVLTEPEKPLETGVEFMAHPPGKKLTRLSLLSGGEKALSAIAFLFSIFMMKPASFCFLDEIDAPLDEANVHRFNELLRTIGETSQIIMITHKKKSMEFADTLFGITMEQKGISKIVSVRLDGRSNDALPEAVADPLAKTAFHHQEEQRL